MKRFLIIAALSVISFNVMAEELYSVCLPVPVSVYENAVTDAKIIGTLSPKQEVEVYVVNGDWAIIKYGNGVGYVAAACLKKVVTSSAQGEQSAFEQPSVQPAVGQKPVADPKPAVEQKPVVEEKPASTLTTKNMKLPVTDIYEPFASYTLLSSRNKVADVLYCKGHMYITFDYQMTTRIDPVLTAINNNGQDKINLHMGQFNFGGIAKLWGPIGLDFGFGLGVGGAKYDLPAPSKYGSDGKYYVFDKTTRFKLDYNLYLRPVFWMNVTDDISLHLFTGPRFDIIFLEDDHSSVNGDRKFAGDVDYAGIGGKGKYPYRILSIPWGVGLGFNYKHIGVRVMYEWEIYGGYTDKYATEHGIDRTMFNAHQNCLTAQLFIPIIFF